MSKASTYQLGADVPDTEVLRDRQGRVVDEAYGHGAVTEALTRAADRAGRPCRSPASRRCCGCGSAVTSTRLCARPPSKPAPPGPNGSARSSTTPPTVPDDPTAVAAVLLTGLLTELSAPPGT